VSATFFVPGVTVETWPDLCRRILDEGRGKEHGARFMTARSAAEDWIAHNPFTAPG
jgi:peptidoglycan/xylan/chitin deacetylase (PgdA/CDA1 family)